MNFAHKIITVCFLTLLTNFSFGQAGTQMVRLARIVVDSAKLENYKVLLKQGVEASLRLEPGVLALYAVSENDKPTHFTILEIYADSSAYLSHLKTPHFAKYKTGTKDMVQTLELIEVTPLVPEMKIKDRNNTKKK